MPTDRPNPDAPKPRGLWQVMQASPAPAAGGGGASASASPFASAAPANPDERIELAILCGLKRLNRAAVRFYEEVFAAEPKLLPVHRYHAASVAALARTIHDEQRFADMPRLADVLEEAGCADVVILSHCRSGGPHVRGCWVLDLLLDKR